MFDFFSRQSAPDSGERALNGFLRAAEGEAGTYVLLGRGGLARQFDLGGEVRAQVLHQGVLYVVAGGQLWRIDGGATALGSIIDGETSIASGQTQVAIVSSNKYWVYNSRTGTLSSPRPSELVDVRGVCEMDGYFILWGSDLSRDDAMYASALDDATSFDPLDFAYAEGKEDRLERCLSDHDYFFAFGSETVEIYYNSSGFPFTRNKGAGQTKGCYAGNTVTQADERVFYVDSNKTPRVATIGAAQVIAPAWVTERLEEGTILGAFAFKEQGSEFYAIRLEGEPALVYDIQTQLWHERATGLDREAWIATCAVTQDGVCWVGATTGALCKIEKTTYEDDGAAIILEAVSRPDMSAGRTVNRVEVATGGGGEDIGRTPQIMLQAAKKPGAWGREKWRPLPLLGEHGKRSHWDGFGWSKFWQARIRITDPVNRDILGVYFG